MNQNQGDSEKCLIGCRENRGITDRDTQAVCEVCRLLDNNHSEQTCRYCGTCDAWICDKCRPDLIRRAKAFLKSI